MSQGQAATAPPRVSLAEGTRFERLDSHTYKIHLHSDFCIGAVPNGGYTASCMLAAANAHLGSRGQPDTFTAHFEFTNKTAAGPGIIVIDEVKLGRQVSTLHLTLWQGDILDHAPWFVASSSRRKVLAYTTQVDLKVSTGPSFPTGYQGTSAAAMPATPDFDLVKKKGTDGKWKDASRPSNPLSKGSLGNWDMLIPSQGALTPGVCDVWISAVGGQRITQATLPYVVDAFPFDVLAFFTPPGYFSPDDPEALAKRSKARRGLWFPTVLLNLEIKKLLPEQGVEWLNMSITTKQIKDGRLDIEVMVRDLAGELVALSSQVSMILSMDRNTSKTGSWQKKAAL
ncbi:hypothetical protein EsDP_00007169 [Epichloe bromicola]|uniref:Thioesterase family protein n=1 Tax=Epichloe bromicola TaxID=79588 RepID=A0ABQ0CZR9_9HYPO